MRQTQRIAKPKGAQVGRVLSFPST